MGRHAARTREEFIETALRQVDETGLEALSLRDLGASLGVGHTAVYTHFADKQALIDALVEEVAGAIVAGGPLSGATPRARLRDLALRSYRVLARHPRLVPAFLQASGNVGSTHTVTRATLMQLEEAGLVGRELGLAQQAVEGYAIGVILWDHGGAPEHLRHRRDRYAASRHPAIAEIRTDAQMAAFNEEAFLHGFDRLLTGIGLSE